MNIRLLPSAAPAILGCRTFLWWIMSLDTKYRPTRYSDVIGQEPIIKILKSIVKSGGRYHQSYLFSGPWGSGKSTLARILARALLCHNPLEGGPCDQCPSCLAVLSGQSPDYTEVDAATNSGKDDVKRILEEVQYSSFSGNRKIYILDESHALSKQGLDALLIPMEECIKGTQDKKLVCIFCTTEPEKMRATVLSRCAPSFVVQPSPLNQISDRLEYVCSKENLKYERGALEYISSYSESHIRDALKILEGVSSLGGITGDLVKQYLNLDNYDNYFRIVLSLGSDLDKCTSLLESVLKIDSPSQFYSKIVNIFLFSYKVGVGISNPPVYLNSNKLKEIYSTHGKNLLSFASALSEKLYEPSQTTAFCDIYALHQLVGTPPDNLLENKPIEKDISSKKITENTSGVEVKKDTKPTPIVSTKITGDGVYVNSRAINTNRPKNTVTLTPAKETSEMEPDQFRWLLDLKLAENKSNGSRKA